MAQKEYTRIGGRGKRRREFFTWNSLWLGADHLLMVEHTGYAEEYKRFYFSDIQSITIRQNRRALFYSILFLVMLAAAVAAMIAAWNDLVGRWILGVASAVSFLLLLINVIKGPSCEARIRTAVHDEEVPPLRRVKRTNRELSRIRPFILAAQEPSPQAMPGALTLPTPGTPEPPPAQLP